MGQDSTPADAGGWRSAAGRFFPHGRGLLALSLPLVLSNSFWTIQITVDRVLLTRVGGDAVGAAMAGAMLFWAPFALIQQTAGYVSVFVAQYTGAGRSDRVGPVVWQAVYFSVLAGLAFLFLIPAADWVVAQGGHTPQVQVLEAVYFRCLCWAALPLTVVAAVNGFFSGRGDSWTVLLINGVGTAVNCALAWVLIFGHFGLPELGIAGAGWAAVAAGWASALTGLVLMLRPKFRGDFGTLSGWRFDPALFRRLMWFGVPNGLLWALDGLAFTAFLFLVGRLGAAELAATSVAFTINMVAILPMVGVGQGVEILVGQRLGEDRPEVAQATTYTGFKLAWVYMAFVASLYVLVPGMFLELFRDDTDGETWAKAALIVPFILRFVAVYSLFDAANLVFSFALRGAGDTKFVTAASVVMAWPIMVVPTYLAWRAGWDLAWPWTFATAYICSLAVLFLLRFRSGVWKSMRVIEAAPVVEPAR